MIFPELFQESPNCDKQRVNRQYGVVVHHTELSFVDTIAHMLKPESKVSYHVVISKSGERCTLVLDRHIAWHAGISSFAGQTNCNDFMIGLAFEGDTDQESLTSNQIESALEWLRQRWTSNAWNLDRITDHRQVAPGRKRDLNPVEWDRLKAALKQRVGSF